MGIFEVSDYDSDIRITKWWILFGNLKKKLAYEKFWK